MQRWRLIHSAPAGGATNMALDEAILMSVAAGNVPPTLRFYAWEPPCLSLGVAQFHAEADTARLAEQGWGLVRRPTGGKAILHTDELTYSVTLPKDSPLVAGDVVESYRRLSQGLAAGLEILGLRTQSDRQADPNAARQAGPVCFEVPSHYEITAGGKKLIGSAQVRKRGGMLQHGTLPLTGDLARICDGLVFADEAARVEARARVLARATTLGAALGRRVFWDEAAAALAAGFAAALGVALEPGALTTGEAAVAEKLCAEKYGAPGWTQRR
ncbi:MAG: lipoate--protein ligase family protein [Anaerolineae bacterium]|nr:lipoate--protein ligase family protein [Anaerolineae bacterium]